MATCQGTPTATQYTTSVGTSYAERTTISTIFSTINPGNPALKARQGPTDSPTPTPTNSISSSSSSDGSFGIQEVTTIIETITFTETSVFTNTIPILTLYAPCSTSESTSRSNSASMTSQTASTSAPASDILTDLSLSSMHSDAKATTTSGGMTIVISEFITTVNGVETIYATPIQTLLNTSDGVLNTDQRTAVIAGSAVGAVLVLVALLGLLFYFRRTRQVRERQMEEKRAKERPPRYLLEDEADDFNFGSRGGPPMMAQHWESTSFTSGGSSPSAPRLLRVRGSRTGSLFQEDVWPPPTEVMQDPLLTAHDLGSSISLAMGFPPEGVAAPQLDVTQQLQQATTLGVSSADAYALPMGGGHGDPQQRSSAYESIRSTDTADYYYHARAHSRAESIEPLLDDAGQTSVSPPPRNPTSSNNTVDQRGRKSNLRMSYTADEVGNTSPGVSISPTRPGHLRAGTGMSGQSAGSMSSPRNEMASSPDGEGVFAGVSRAAEHGAADDRAEELPPLYHTIPRHSS